MEFLKGHLTISQPQGDRVDYVSIQVEDATSGSHFIEIRVPYAEFTRALGSRQANCTFEVRGVKLLGATREHKTEQVLVLDGPYTTDRERAAAAAKPFEVDGWRGYYSDGVNNHRMGERADGGMYYTMSFTRYIAADGTPIELDND